MTTTPTPVLLAPGRLPPPWNRPGIFVANLLGLFFGNDEQTAALRTTIGRLESYGGRLLPVMGLLFRSSAPNTIVLEQAPQPTLLRYFADDLRLELPRIHVLPHDELLALARAAQADAPLRPAMEALLDRLRETPTASLDGFVTDDSLLALAARSGHETLSCRQGSFEGNHKRLLHDHLVAAGLPTFTTRLVEDAAALPGALRALAAAGYTHAALKSPIGASGIGLWRLDTTRPAPGPPAYAFAHGACLLQGWIEPGTPADVTAVHSPSTQLLVRPEAVHVYDLTDQILSSESIHQGNAAPPSWLVDAPPVREALFRQTTSVARWLHGRGYRGAASIDFHVTRLADGSHQVRVCEVNARVTGATYPALLARHFTPDGAWLMRNVRFDPAPDPADVLAGLRRAGVLYQPGDTRGLLPINFNPDPAGGVAKGQFLSLAPALDAAAQLLDTLPDHLPVAATFDRD